MDLLAQFLKGLISRATIAGSLMLCALPVCNAAVMEFPDATSAPIGLDQQLNDIDDAGFGTGSGTAEAAPDTDLLPDVSARPPADDIVNSVLGVSPSENWLEDSRKAQLAQPGNAFTLMKAYVNIINNSYAASDGGPQQPNQTGGGAGFLTSLAKGINDADTLNLITQVMQPHIENDLVTFSVLGFGQFMIVGQPDSGDLALMDLANGRQVNVRNASPDRYADAARAAPRVDTQSNVTPLIPNEGETMAQLLLLLLAVATNPMFILTAVCILSIWLLYRLAKRFS
jgi:hypothetical protein